MSDKSPQADGAPLERQVRPIVDRLRERAVELDADAEAAFSDSGIDAGLLKEAAAEIERAWAARDAAVSDLEAHAAAEVRRSVAAERERMLSMPNLMNACDALGLRADGEHCAKLRGALYRP